MNSEDFISSIRLAIEQTEIGALMQQLQNPAGRSPKESIVVRSTWYNALSVEDKAHLDAVIKDSVRATVFGFLCSLDGVRKISEKGHLELREICSKTGKSNVISDGNFGSLHDIYLSVLEQEEGQLGSD